MREYPAAVARLQATLDAAKVQSRQPAPQRGTLLSTRALAQVLYERELDLDNRTRDYPGLEVRPKDYNLMFADAYLAALTRVVSGTAANDEMDATIGWALDDFVERGHAKLERGSTEWRATARALAGAQVEAIRRSKERDQGDFSGKPVHPILADKAEAITPNDPLALRVLGPDSTLPLSKLLPKFLAERHMSAASENEQAVSVRMFEEHLGETRPVYKITRRDVIAYKNALLEAPSNYTKRFPHTPLPDAIRANKLMAKPFDTLAPRTVNDKWLSTLRSLLNWCVNNDVIPDSPATGIKVTYQADKGRPSRVNFDPSDLAKIFSRPLFSRTEPWDETQWAYLLSLYCGTRPSELAQVRLNSIWHERGILVMRIEEETKNIGSQRAIPIHGALIKLGFEKRIDNLRRKKETHLFPDWYRQGQESKRRAETKAKGNGNSITLNQHYPKFLPKRFNVSYRKKVGITDDRKDFYSFRHTFKTGLAHAGVAKEIRDYLAGHRDHSAGSVYEHGVSLETMREAVEKLHFDGLTLFT